MNMLGDRRPYRHQLLRPHIVPTTTKLR